MESRTMINEDAAAPPAPEPEAGWRDKAAEALSRIRGWAKTREFWLIAGLLVSICFAFWSLMRRLAALWTDFDGYYAHGLLIPVASAWLVWRKREALAKLPLKGSWIGLVVLLPSLYVATLAGRTQMPFVESILFLAVLAAAIVIIGGFRWLAAMAAPLLFLALGLPILDRFIDQLTYNLQVVSTNVAEVILKIGGQNPYREDATVIYLDNFTMNIAEACSGLKTTIAVTSSVLFFMLISQLRWWGNAVLAVIAIPLSVLVNGLRVAMIGFVGNRMGEKAGLDFHDYSGYIALIVCFAALSQITRILEPKNS